MTDPVVKYGPVGKDLVFMPRANGLRNEITGHRTGGVEPAGTRVLPTSPGMRSVPSREMRGD